MLREAFGGKGLFSLRGAVTVPLLILVVMVVSVAVRADSAVDISVETIRIDRSPGAASAEGSLGLDQGLVGDTLHVSALVKNVGTSPVGQFKVDFFFTEMISGEHGRIGTQTVLGLDPGGEIRPVVVVDTSTFTPGIYAFSAEADPAGLLGEEDRCNNIAPRGSCAGQAKERQDKYKLTLLREGKSISELSVTPRFPVCRMGKLEETITVHLYNVGTEPLTKDDVEVWGYYRLGLDPPADQFTPLVVDAAENPVQLSVKSFAGLDPGKDGYMTIGLSFDVFDRLFEPRSTEENEGEDLGNPYPVQLRMTVKVGTDEKDIFLPDQFRLAQFYSAVDLWTFPARPVCSCTTYEDIESISVPPAVAGGLVFHVVSTAGGDRLHVLKVNTGEEKGSWEAPNGIDLTSPAAFYDSTGNSYRIYLGGSDGKVYALQGEEKEEGAFLTSLWTSPSDIVSPPRSEGATSHLRLSSDGTKLIVGSENGVFVLDAASGDLLGSYTSYGPVSTKPAYVDATGAIWFASDEEIYGILPNGSECTYDVKDRVTTSLELNGTGTSLFFGTESGSVYAVDAVVGGGTCTVLASADPLRTVVGMAVATAEEDAVIYLTSDIGEIARVEYDERKGFTRVTTSERDFEPTKILVAPALLENRKGDDADAVLVAGEWKEKGARTLRPVLQGWKSDLTEYETVKIWGSSVSLVFEPEEDTVIPQGLLMPVIDQDWKILLVASSDGYLYAFDLSGI